MDAQHILHASAPVSNSWQSTPTYGKSLNQSVVFDEVAIIRVSQGTVRATMVRASKRPNSEDFLGVLVQATLR